MKRNVLVLLLAWTALSAVLPTALAAQQRAQQPGNGLTIPFVDINLRPPATANETALSVQLLVLLTVLSLAPSFLILMTSFLRLTIVLDFVKRALGLQQAPPNTVMMGIALFLTLFIMFPVFNRIYADAYVPYSEGKITTTQFLQKAESPLRLFMFRQMESNNHDDIKLFMRLSNLPKPNTMADVPTYVLVPAFILHEMTVAFKMGILIFIPFIIIDMVVSSVLMAMGMIMLPPVMISAPFKLILFVMIDGWTLLVTGLVRSFNL